MMRDDAPVADVRTITDRAKLFLYVRAGGRCEFDGCNEYVLEHHVTLDPLNVGQMAHIVAFKVRGPRGDDPERPADINDPDNLMLLCHRCHTEIDNRETGAKFTRAILEGFKRDHEKVIFHLTDRKTQKRTTILELRSKIGGQVTSLPPAHVWDAVSPRYPDREWFVINLATFDDDSPAYYQLASREIETRVQRLYDYRGDGPLDVSVFGLAAMPLLIFLGSRLSNKGPVHVYQKHRDTQDWTWKPDGPLVEYGFRCVRRGTDRERVALVLSLSARIDLDRLPASIDATYTVYELFLSTQEPSPLFLRRRDDLAAFQAAYHAAHGAILRDHGSVTAVDLFPAVPAPIAVACGFELFPKVSPVLRIWDHDRRQGGWVHVLDIGQPR
jgi:hypothetical protein